MRVKYFLFVLFFPFAFHIFSLFFLHFNETFKFASFIHGFEKSYSQNVSGLNSDLLKEAFQQPFYYLAQGKQMTVFISSDQKYVLKLFNPMRPLRKNWYKKWKYWKQCSSLKWISREWFQKKVRLRKLFKRHRIAFENIPEQTGLIYVHLTSSKNIPPTLSIFDQKKRKYTLSLASTPFVLQQKATLVPNYLNHLLEKNQLNEAKDAIQQIEKLFLIRIEKGITDRIQTMENNYGFVGAKPIQLDVGRIQVDLEIQKYPEKEQNRILTNFHNWLKKNYPGLL